MTNKKQPIKAHLILEDGHIFQGTSFGYPASVSGEVVFNTGMTGYPESLTDPSYYGQILCFTYPLIGNYGIPRNKQRQQLGDSFESDHIQVKGLVVSDYSDKYSHWKAQHSLGKWLSSQKISAIREIDVRSLTQILREQGTMLGKIVIGKSIDWFDPAKYNLVSRVSIKKSRTYGQGKTRIALLDCGCKHNILRSLLKREVEVLRLAWDADVSQYDFSGLLISNGPGDPSNYPEPLQAARYAFDNNIPTMGICLGHQLMALAIGAQTFKLKYGHRSQNQPVIDLRNQKSYITSQNHGYAVDAQTLDKEWHPWFTNLNDKTNEGMRHDSGRFFSVQFHPEAAPGPMDTGFLFDEFLTIINQS